MSSVTMGSTGLAQSCRRFERPLDVRTFSSEDAIVKGSEFIRRVKQLGSDRGLVVTVDASRGKGSHQTLYFGSAFTVIRNPKDELKTGTFHAMCSQLGIKASDL